MTELTVPQARVLELLIAQVEKDGTQPTMRQISETFGWSSPNAAVGHIRALAAKGFIRLPANGYNGVALLKVCFQRRSHAHDQCPGQGAGDQDTAAHQPAPRRRVRVEA